jgi:hypothetical protein
VCVYVTQVTSYTATAMTVVRGVGGTVALAHSLGQCLSPPPPPPVVACAVKSVRDGAPSISYASSSVKTAPSLSFGVAHVHVSLGVTLA